LREAQALQQKQQQQSSGGMSQPALTVVRL